MSLLGALVGANKVDQRREAWRWTLGGSGIALLGLTLFAVSDSARTAYLEYFIYKRVKSHYVVLISWQDVLSYVFTACVLMGLLALAVYLLRSAFRAATPNQIAANS
jgi:hypothetical protein